MSRDMPLIDRRRVLGWCAVAPALPTLLAQAARAAGASSDARAYDGRVLVVVRMLGGNDGLNTVVPVRDDRYYQLRPNIALRGRDVLPMPGGDRALNRHLAALRDVMAQGHAGILQGVGYPASSRSHLRATEIWETGSVADPSPAAGWIGRYLDAANTGASVAGLQFGGDVSARTLAATSAQSRLVGHPDMLLHTRLDAPATMQAPASPALARVLATQSALRDAAAELRQARRGSGSRFDYPDTAFGAALRWTADLIEGHGGARAYYLSIGSFEGSAASFDTHLDELAKHAELFPQLGEGLRAFTGQLRRSGDLDRVLLTTFSDFGRHVAENRTGGTEHGDAGLLFYAGGKVRAGLQGVPADLGKVSNGGLDYGVDFRSVYAEVLENWLGMASAPLLGQRFGRAGILST